MQLTQDELLHCIKQEISSIDGYKYENILSAIQIGSRAHGNATPESDYDLYCVVMPPYSYVKPLVHVNGYDEPKVLRNVDRKAECKGFELDIKFISGLNWYKNLEKGAPNALEVLRAREEHILYSHKAFAILTNNYGVFETKCAIPKFLGTSKSHWMDYLKTGNNKQASEAFRMLFDCRNFLRRIYHTGNQAFYDWLPKIKAGELTKEMLVAWEASLREEIAHEEANPPEPHEFYIVQNTCKGPRKIPDEVNKKVSREVLLDFLENFYG